MKHSYISVEVETPEPRALFDSHLNLARSVARRFRGRDAEDEELESVALVALLEAAHRWGSEPKHGVTFGAWAEVPIRDALRAAVRDTPPVARVHENTPARVRDGLTLMIVEDRLRQMPVTAATLARAVIIEGEEAEIVAGRLGLNPRTARRMVERVRAQLREDLS